jgi:hypothetical protein
MSGTDISIPHFFAFVNRFLQNNRKIRQKFNNLSAKSIGRKTEWETSSAPIQSGKSFTMHGHADQVHHFFVSSFRHEEIFEWVMIEICTLIGYTIYRCGFHYKKSDIAVMLLLLIFLFV